MIPYDVKENFYLKKLQEINNQMKLRVGNYKTISRRWWQTA